MRCKPFNLFLLAFQFAWFNAILPGHTRGQVAMPDYGAASSAASPDATVAAEAPSCPLCSGGGKPAKKGDPARHCAVCFFAAHLHVPPPIALIHSPLGRATGAAPIAAERCDPVDRPARYRSRAPPAA